MSLFGNLGGGANKPPGGGAGLFGNAGGSAPATTQSTPSLFGGAQTGASSTASSGGVLFGNAGANNTGSSGGGLFGNAGAANTGSTGAGLFGNAGQQNNSNQTKPSLFNLGGSTSNNTADNASAPSGGGLFGGMGGQTNNTQQPAAASGGGLGLYATSTNATGGSAQAQGANTTQDGQPAQNGQAKPLFFDQLIERGKKRQGQEAGIGMGQFGELPSLQLGLGDIAKKVRGLGHTNTDSRAHYLLSASGVNTGEALRDLSLFTNDAATRAPLPASAFDCDIETFVDNIFKQNIQDGIKEQLEKSKRDFDRFIEEKVQFNREASRRRIYEHFGLVKKDENAEATFTGTASNAARGAFGRSSRREGLNASVGAGSVNRSVLGATGRQTSRQSLFSDVAEKAPAGIQPVTDDRMLRDKQEKYANKVKDLNVARLGENCYPILHNFADVEAQPSVEDTSHLVNAYKALAEIVGESPEQLAPSDAGAVRPRQFAKDYLDDAPASAKAFDLRKRIIGGSRKFLEKLFFSQLETAILKNAKEAALGGVPSVINKVRAYIRLRAIRKELGSDNVQLQTLNDDYCWVLIFYLLRAGLVSEAAQYVAENERAIKTLDRNFPTYLASYANSPDRRLPQDLQSRITNTYSQRAQLAPENSVDPYRMACFKIIGRCELGRRTLDGVNQNMEDWVWLQFALAREVNRVEETASEVFGLEDVRNVIHEVGQRHFVQGAEGATGYGTYFFLQILAGQFESAIAWLYPNNYLSAVHFAIALNYYGLLRVNDFNGGEDLLSYTTRQQPQISFGHIVGYYTRDFRASRTTAAVDYLALICLNGDTEGETGKRQIQLCHEALRELVLETREFASLLGDIRADGQRIQGSIEQRLKLIRIDDEQSFLRHITISAAQIAEDNGRVTDAVLLFHLADEYDNVINICNKALSDAIAVEMGDAPLLLEPLKPRDPSGMPATVPEVTSASLSLTSVEDPYQLARNMRSLYESNAIYTTKVRSVNRDACTILLGIAEAKSLVGAGRWASALDALNSLNLLPISAGGNVGLIRASANAFSALPNVVARNIGNLLIWTITCCGNQRDVLRSSSSGFEERGKDKVINDILQAAKDIMVFAGLIRYKLTPKVFEILARVAGDVGAY